MKITKFKHSCLLVENEKARVLFDPGEFSWQDFRDELESITDLDYVVITHEHGDHYLPEALITIYDNNPTAKIICGEQVASMLEDDGVKLERAIGSELFKVTTVEHAHLDQTVPVFEDIRVVFDGKLLHPGDNMEIEESPEVLALPIFGPWYNGTLSDAIDLAIKLKPKFVIPIHDWHYKDEVREDFQNRLKDRTKSFGITVLTQPDGEAIEV